MAGDAAPSTVRQRLFFALLYFSEGAPIGYIWWAMPTRLRAAGMPVDEVASLTALLALPWALKFLWAPAVDRIRGRGWGYRAWITSAQIAMGLTLLPIALGTTEDLLDDVKWLLLAHAFAAATQDVSIDALAIATVPEHERARLTGWMQAGMLLGRAAFGGLALAAEQWIGAGSVVLVLIGCIWMTLAVLWLTPRSVGERTAAQVGGTSLVPALVRALCRRSTWIGLGVALTAGAGFEAAGGLMGPFLLDGGVTQSQIGWFLAAPVIGAMIFGAVLGGWLADRHGHTRMVFAGVLAVALSIVLLVSVRSGLPDRAPAILAASLPLYACIGVLTASSYAYFMDLTDPAIGGTQFSAFMSATNLCEVWSVGLAGVVAVRAGYSVAFLLAAGMSTLTLVLLSARRDKQGDRRTSV